MGWFNRNKTVHVTFIDDATGQPFGESAMPPEQLPETFEIATTLHIKDVDWSVMSAEPRTREACRTAGKLTLRLLKIEMMPTNELRFSQVDYTEGFDDNRRLGPDDWLPTRPLNATVRDYQTAGLPPPDAGVDEVYRVAAELSALRESLPLPDDGVYCPICHIANIDLTKLHTPCPKCDRGLLKFGWT